MNTMFAHFLQKRLGICGVIAACAMTTLFAGGQAPKARILSEIAGSERISLKGSQHPLARPQNEAGRMPADARLNGVTIYFSRSASQQADLDALLAAQQNPSSPLYHQWLTPDAFAARFGMAQSDIDKVQNWLQQQGFSIDSVSRSRNAIRFSGAVGQVESAFGTQMHYFASGGVRHFAPSTELSMPASMAAAVATVRNLNDFRPRPQVVVPRTAFTSNSSGNVFFAPGDIATTYDIKPLSSGGITGAGQTIVVAGQTSIQVSDIENFQTAAGLTQKDPTLVLMPGTGNAVTPTSTGDQGESDLDVEWSTSMAPGANVVFVYTGSNTAFGVFDSIQYAVDEKIGQIISLSYASCETEITAADLTSLEGMFSQAAAQGQTVISASGDQGSTACSGDTHLTTLQQQAIAVNYPASSAYVTGMGGTEIDSTDIFGGSNYSTYWIAASGSDVSPSAKTYIPEVVWNDNSIKFGLSATGGGASALVSRPAWQTGVPGIASGTFRLVPDISLYSSPGLPGYLYCTSDTSNWNTTSAPVQTASCNSGFRDATTSQLTVAGGTSFATPIFAGMLALINQKAGYVTGQGLVNPTLYKLAANSATYASAFHDVTSGNNNCTASATVCGSTTTGFSAGPGYDEVTGLGSVDLNNLATAWPVNTGASAGLKGTTTSVVAASATPAVNVADTFTITVAEQSGSGIPTGSVTLQVDGGTTFGGTTVTGQTLLANGTVTYSATFATAGSHQVVAQYLGDATHAPSTGVGSVTIPGKGTFALAATNLTVARGSSGASTITVTPAGGYTGTVNLTFATSNSTALTNLCYSFITNVAAGGGSVAVTGTTAVTTQLTLDARASDCVTPAKSGSGRRALRLAGKAHASRTSGTSPVPAGLAFAALLLIGFMGRTSRKLRNMACICALAAAGFALTACGGSSSSGGTTATNPPKGTYTVTVTGADSVTSAITANTSFTFTIN